MVYLWGPGLDAEVEYRRSELGKAARAHWLRRARRAVAMAGRDRPRPW
jgi:hypothetical protein